MQNPSQSNRPAFPAPVYRDTVLAPIFADAKKYFLEPLLRIERVHTLMLTWQGIMSVPDAAACLRALDALDIPSILATPYDGTFEDLFFLVERDLIAVAGDAAERMHTARSRNDIDLTMYRMLMRQRLLQFLGAQLQLRGTLVALAEEHRAALMPAYTHNQPAQPTTLGHYLMAVVEILERDAQRVCSAYGRVNRCPLGACAITTTGFPIDRDYTADLLGFEGLQTNSYGAIAAVDYLAESCSVLATAMVSLGRFAQDLLLWSTVEFGYLRLSDGFVQISSIMPQKRNPVPLEHVRILASRALTRAQSVLGCLHNTPFADMNDAEDPLQPEAYHALEDGEHAVQLLSAALAEATFRLDRMAKAAEGSFLTVTELADTLVRESGMSFHEAHGIVSRAVRSLPDGYDRDALAKFVETELAAWPERAANVSSEKVLTALSAANFVAVRRVPGGPALEALQPEIARARHQLQRDGNWLTNVEADLAAAEQRTVAASNALLHHPDAV